MEILRTIAFLCTLSSPRESADYIEKKQLECQQYYVKCLNADNLTNYKQLTGCVQKRKL
jgi:hypothetical protein